MTAQRGKPLSRRAGRREQRDRFLIYAEGDVSETIYLKGVRSDLGRSGPAATNPRFELWLILHFRDQHDALTTKDACDHLMGLPCGYDKHGKAFSYALCRDRREAAAGRADALMTRYDDAVPLRDRNPWTSVQELFRRLQNAAAI
jgi:hypothetical protein